MELTASGRFVFVAQWVLAILMPAFVAVGRAIFGVEIGWMAVIGIWIGLPVIITLLLPPVLGLFDGPARRAGRVRSAVAVATIAMWVAMVVMAAAIPDGGDNGGFDSALTAWTGMSDDASMVVFVLFTFVAALAWLAAVVAAVVGIVRGRRES
jgi:hypothetical protein